jgi:hypothetical protein
MDGNGYTHPVKKRDNSNQQSKFSEHRNSHVYI